MPEDDIISRLGRLSYEKTFQVGDEVFLRPYKNDPNYKLRGRITRVCRYGLYHQTTLYETDIPWGSATNGVGGLNAHWLALASEEEDEATNPEEDHQGSA